MIGWRMLSKNVLRMIARICRALEGSRGTEGRSEGLRLGVRGD